MTFGLIDNIHDENIALFRYQLQIAGAATECWVVTGGEGYVGAGLAAPGCLLAAPPPPGRPPPRPRTPPPGARARPPAGSLLCRYIHIRNGAFISCFLYHQIITRPYPQ